jgi:hypothetical protein
MRDAFRLDTAMSSHNNISQNWSILVDILQKWHPKILANIVTYVKHLKKLLENSYFLP